jgi:hypothetical protein
MAHRETCGWYTGEFTGLDSSAGMAQIIGNLRAVDFVGYEIDIGVVLEMAATVSASLKASVRAVRAC